MATSRAAIFGLLLVFSDISAQNNPLQEPCECTAGDKRGCICTLDIWCNADNEIKLDFPVSFLIENSVVTGFTKCQSAKGEKCCRLPASLHIPRRKLECGRLSQDRIATLDNTAVGKKQYPWLMEILLKNGGNYEYKCWGSLIHPEVVVTATHCLKTILWKNLARDEIKILSNIIKSDDHEFPDTERQEKFAKKVIIYTPFIPWNLTNDISLIFLESPMSINEFVEPICLPPANFKFEENKKCVLAGWESTNQTRKYLQKTEVLLIERSKCEKLILRNLNGVEFDLDESFICAGEEGRESCLGDGGSPLVCDYDKGQAYQVGLASWRVNTTCGVKDLPSCYVNVPIFVDWIKNTVRSEGIDFE